MGGFVAGMHASKHLNTVRRKPVLYYDLFRPFIARCCMRCTECNSGRALPVLAHVADLASLFRNALLHLFRSCCTLAALSVAAFML